MAEFDCKYHIAHEQQLARHEGDIKEIKTDITDLRLTQTEVNSKFVSFMESMSKLPEILESMKEAITGTGYEIKSMKEDIEEIKVSQSKNEQKVEGIDNEGKVNTRTWVRDNFGKLVAIVGIGSLVVGAIVAFVLETVLK